MSKCLKCNVSFTDDTSICPLCRQILEPIPGETLTKTYPNIKEKHKKDNIGLNIFGFIALIVEATLVIINLTTSRDLLWCLITGAALLYVFLTIKMSLNKHIDLRMRFLFHSIAGVILLLLVDYLFGFAGWSFSFVIPIAILFMDMVIFVLMMVNRHNFQSYIWVEILVLCLSAIPIIGIFLKLADFFILAVVALGVSAILYLGTIIIGGQKATAELTRRFHL